MGSDNHKYGDIINLPHHVSKTHPPMDIMDRAAQFSPFAALTGYKEAAEETRRLTQPKIQLDETQKELLDIELHKLEAGLLQKTVVTVTYFIPDQKKDGGVYHTVSGTVRKIDHYRRILCIENKEEIPVENIIDITSEH